MGGESVDSHYMLDCICHMTDDHSGMETSQIENKLFNTKINLHLDLALTAEQRQLGEELRGV